MPATPNWNRRAGPGYTAGWQACCKPGRAAPPRAAGGRAEPADDDAPALAAGGDGPAREVAVCHAAGTAAFAGADADGPVEQVEVVDGGAPVTLRAAVRAGQHVRRAGDDIQPGDTLVEAGTVVSSGQLGVLATVGAGGQGQADGHLGGALVGAGGPPGPAAQGRRGGGHGGGAGLG